jgi:hypothetical protein
MMDRTPRWHGRARRSVYQQVLPHVRRCRQRRPYECTSRSGHSPVLIVGASGGTGRHAVAEALRAGYDTRSRPRPRSGPAVSLMLRQPARIALMTTIGVTKPTPVHDWKHRGERVVRATGPAGRQPVGRHPVRRHRFPPPDRARAGRQPVLGRGGPEDLRVDRREGACAVGSDPARRSAPGRPDQCTGQCSGQGQPTDRERTCRVTEDLAAVPGRF